MKKMSFAEMEENFQVVSKQEQALYVGRTGNGWNEWDSSTDGSSWQYPVSLAQFQHMYNLGIWAGGYVQTSPFDRPYIAAQGSSCSYNYSYNYSYSYCYAGGYGDSIYGGNGYGSGGNSICPSMFETIPLDPSSSFGSSFAGQTVLKFIGSNLPPGLLDLVFVTDAFVKDGGTFGTNTMSAMGGSIGGAIGTGAVISASASKWATGKVGGKWGTILFGPKGGVVGFFAGVVVGAMGKHLGGRIRTPFC